LFKQRHHELSTYLDANQINVEHRYFNESRPDSMDWRYLTVKQAAADHHRLVQLLRTIYSGKWVSTGISKGGQTALFHRRFYPDDVEATVAYVAPIPLAPEDQRLNEFIETLGDPSCRERMKKYQRRLLENRKELVPIFETWAKEKGQNFSIGLETAFEYAVLEYPFSFWQTGATNCAEILGNGASVEELFAHLQTAVPLGLYSDRQIAYFQVSYYQFFTEIGYYGFVTSHLKDLLVALPNPSNKAFVPKNVEVTYNPRVMQDIINWLQNKGNNIIYIYGGQDAWTGAAVDPTERTNALKLVIPGKHHNVRIRHFSEREKETIFSTLESWLDMKIAH
ncbi:MAG: S28 family serine protease, partial [bacterium]